MESSRTSQARSKRETLLSRSKRIIGKQLSTNAKDDDQTDDSASSTPHQNDTSKRRAQILKAQRTHRRRTQNYIQELEKEVLRLRAREAELMREIESLSSNSSSRSRSQSYGIPSPPASTASAQPTELHTNQGTPAVTIDLTTYSEMEPEYPCSIQAATIPQPEYSRPSVDIAAYLSNVEINDAGASAGSVCALDTQTAIDFILELERPCLSHVKFDFEKPKPSRFKVPNFNAGFSHACTTSAAIIHSHQHVDFATQKFSIPAQEIDRLLESSRSLPLGPEMTPVQVWAILIDISNHQTITTAAVSALKGELAKYMHCNAFGTTIEIDTLRQILNFFFPWYSTSQLHDQHLPQTELAKQRLTTTLGEGWQDYF